MNQNIVGFGAGSSNPNLMGLDPTSLMVKSSDIQTSVPKGNVEVSKLVETIRENIIMFGIIRDDIKGYVCKRDGLDINSKEWLSAGRMITKSEVLSLNTYTLISETERAQIELIFEQLSSELNEGMFNIADGSEKGRVLVKRNGNASYSEPATEVFPGMLINGNPQDGLIQPIA